MNKGAATGLFRYKNPGVKIYFEDSLEKDERINCPNNTQSSFIDFSEIPEVENSRSAMPIFLTTLAGKNMKIPWKKMKGSIVRIIRKKETSLVSVKAPLFKLN